MMVSIVARSLNTGIKTDNDMILDRVGGWQAPAVYLGDGPWRTIGRAQVSVY